MSGYGGVDLLPFRTVNISNGCLNFICLTDTLKWILVTVGVAVISIIMSIITVVICLRRYVVFTLISKIINIGMNETKLSTFDFSHILLIYFLKQTLILIF